MHVESPLVKIGIMTDTHIKRSLSSCAKLKRYLEFFRKQQVEMLFNLGDVCDKHYVTGYRAYRKTFNQVFAGVTPPKEVILYANHDRMRDGVQKVPPAIPSVTTFGEPWPEALRDLFKEMKKELQIPNEPQDDVKFKGYHFIVLPQWWESIPEVEALLKKATEDTPDKPVFVLDHVPGFDTVFNTKTWGNIHRNEMFSKFPTVIHLSGHTHGCLRNEQNILQEGYTSVNAGSMAPWFGELMGNLSTEKQNDEALILEIYKDRLLFRRFAAYSNTELFPDKPWCIPWPCPMDNPPYSRKNRMAQVAVPQFAEGARLQLRGVGAPMREWRLYFPQATIGPEGLFQYRVDLYRKKRKDSWELLTQKEMFSDFYLPEEKRTGRGTISFSSAYFKEGELYRFTVTPLDFWGREGTPIETVATAPEPLRGRVLFSSKNPNQDCRYFRGYEDDKRQVFPTERGGFDFEKNMTLRIALPENVWKGAVGTTYRLSLCFTSEQVGPKILKFTLWDPTNRKMLTTRLALPNGRQKQTIVLEFPKKVATTNLAVLVREGDVPAYFQLDAVTLEQMRG